jgi:hypothetical protein
MALSITPFAKQANVPRNPQQASIYLSWAETAAVYGHA